MLQYDPSRKMFKRDHQNQQHRPESQKPAHPKWDNIADDNDIRRGAIAFEFLVASFASRTHSAVVLKA